MQDWKQIVQVAGIKSLTEAKLLSDCGVDLLGFPLALPTNREDISADVAAEIIGKIKSQINCVLITYLNRAEDILDLCDYINTSYVQLHGEISSQEIKRLKSKFPNLYIIKSLVVGKFDLPELREKVLDLEPFCEAFITDSFEPGTGACGATGKTHDLNVSRELIALSRRPAILAGGLTPDNVYESILFARPWGVDVHTGVEDHAGNKDREKVKRFVHNAQAGFKAL